MGQSYEAFLYYFVDFKTFTLTLESQGSWIKVHLKGIIGGKTLWVDLQNISWYLLLLTLSLTMFG
jgi:hypothetical protein